MGVSQSSSGTSRRGGDESGKDKVGSEDKCFIALHLSSRSAGKHIQGHPGARVNSALEALHLLFPEVSYIQNPTDLSFPSYRVGCIPTWNVVA